MLCGVGPQGRGCSAARSHPYGGGTGHCTQTPRLGTLAAPSGVSAARDAGQPPLTDGFAVKPQTLREPPSVHLSFCLSTHLPTCLLIRPSISICPSFRPDLGVLSARNPGLAFPPVVTSGPWQPQTAMPAGRGQGTPLGAPLLLLPEAAEGGGGGWWRRCDQLPPDSRHTCGSGEGSEPVEGETSIYLDPLRAFWAPGVLSGKWCCVSGL